ncbi:MAG: N-acetylneuraminate synthase family protein [Hyphomicrobiales bacterium]
MTGPFHSMRNAAYFIAEIGGNHEGDFEYAKRLCDEAIASGADAIKFQLYRGDHLVSQVSSPDRNAHFRKFELERKQHIELAERVRAAGREYMASVWDEEMLGWIDPYIRIHKVGSGDLTCYPMLRALARTGKPIILSTGLSALDEVRAAVNFIVGEDRAYAAEGKLALLQCTSAYPTPDDAANLRVIGTLRDAFGLPVGYSDHTIGDGAIELAFAMGARLFEKHFTDSREGKTFRDHSISLTRDEVRELLARLRRAEQLLGSPEKTLTGAERDADHQVSFRRSLHARRRIAADEVLSEENVAVLRPCVGIPAEKFYETIGRRAARSLAPFEPIGESDVKPLPQ